MFTVIDKKTGKYPDLSIISATERWANRVDFWNIDCFGLLEDGSLILLDHCGNVSYCPDDRFEVVMDNEKDK